MSLVIFDINGFQAFAPNLKYVLSIGTEHDMMVNVWNWRTGIKVASNKVASKVVSSIWIILEPVK